MQILRFSTGDILVMKKTHPCGTSRFRVLRAGSDVRVLCLGCGRDMTLARESLEKSVRAVEHDLPTEKAADCTTKP